MGPGRTSACSAEVNSVSEASPALEKPAVRADARGKVRGMKAARKLMIQKVREDVEGRLKPLWDSGHLAVKMAYSQISTELREEWREEIHAAFPEMDTIEGEPLTLSIACHTGPGALGVGAVRI